MSGKYCVQRISDGYHFSIRTLSKHKLVGRDPDPRITALANRRSNIEVTGFVDDMRPHFNDSSVYVCPLKSGVGLKNKILEAWSMAKAVVATEMSCDGIDYDDGQDVIIANDARAFADAVIRLLRDSDLRIRLGENGRKRVIEQFSWRSHADKFEEIYKRVAAKTATEKPVEHKVV